MPTENVEAAGPRIPDMHLTAALVEDAIDEYPDVQPLSAVETEHLEMLPDTFERGEYGWRDPEWVVQWYYRRFLGGYPDAERRAAETAYGGNAYEDVRAAISGAVDADETPEKLQHLTALAGVDVPVASAFLQFVAPEAYVVVGERTWSGLHEAGELDGPYPDPPSVPTYERYVETCRAVADRCGCSLWDLYRTLWMLGDEPTNRPKTHRD